MHTHTTPLTMLSSSTGGLRSPPPLRPSTLSAASYLPTTAVRTSPCPRAGFIPPRLPGLSAPAHTDLPSPQTRNIKYFPALPFSSSGSQPRVAVEDAVLQPPAQDRQIKGTFSTCLHLQSIPASIPGVFPLFCEGKKSPFLFPLVSSSSIFDSETARVENTVHPPPVQGRRVKRPFPGASQLQSNQASSPSIFAREYREKSC